MATPWRVFASGYLTGRNCFLTTRSRGRKRKNCVISLLARRRKRTDRSPLISARENTKFDSPKTRWHLIRCRLCWWLKKDHQNGESACTCGQKAVQQAVTSLSVIPRLVRKPRQPELSR